VSRRDEVQAAKARASRMFKAYGIVAMLVALSARTVARAFDLPGWVPRVVVLGAFASLPVVFALLWLRVRLAGSHRGPPPDR
jgi:hypothetical protein